MRLTVCTAALNAVTTLMVLIGVPVTSLATSWTTMDFTVLVSLHLRCLYVILDIIVVIHSKETEREDNKISRNFV